jgi:hypothetical protein
MACSLFLTGVTGGSKMGSHSLNRVVEVLSSAATLGFRLGADFHFHSSFVAALDFYFPCADDCAPLSPHSVKCGGPLLAKALTSLALGQIAFDWLPLIKECFNVRYLAAPLLGL